MRNSLLPILLLATWSGCDIVDQPKGELAAPTPPPGSSVTRNVLLEDCTGFRCNNCPDAAIRAMQLKAIYGDRLVVVGAHMVESFAAPQPPNYLTDFRTLAGTAYEQTFGITALPMGLISRVPFNGSRLVSRYSWSTATAALIDQPADLALRIDSLAFDAGSGVLSGIVQARMLQSLGTPHNITLYLTEDHVIDWQLDGNTHVPDYEHRHVLRAALNNPWGAQFLHGNEQPGDTLELAFSYPLPDNVLQPANCAVVAYVYSTSGADQYEVKQVTERALMP